MNAYRKGANFERQVKRTFKKAGYTVVRSAGSHTEADILVKELGLSVQCKALKRFAGYRLMESADALVVKADRKEPLILLRLERFLRILKGAG